MNKFYNITMISNICGLEPQRLRAWETRYKLVSPKRSENGQRLYTADDLEKIKLVAILIKQGQRVGNIAKLNVAELKSLMESAKIQTNNSDIKVHIDVIEELVNYLKSYNFVEVKKLLTRSRLQYGPREIILGLLLPLIKNVGEMIHNKELDIGQEHALSAIIKSQISKYEIPYNEESNKCIALATPEKNHHELGIMLGEIICRYHQWDTYYFGPNLPARALAKALEATDCYQVVLGGVYSETDELHEFLNILNKSIKTPIEVLIGGNIIGLTTFAHYKNLNLVSVNDFNQLENYLRK